MSKNYRLRCAYRHTSLKPNIVISEVDLFDYSRGEPSAEYTTVLRVLDVCTHSFVNSRHRLMFHADFG